MMQRNRRLLLLAVLAGGLLVSAAYTQETFDHSHTAWTALLKKHLVLLRDGQASQVDYAGFAKDEVTLQTYLKTLSSVTRAQFDRFTRTQQQAFLINAYNAFTVALILTKYPDLESIKDLGSLFSSPWKKEWIPLLGKTLSLDNIEHDILRKRGVYDEPRVHFAVNCASIGCPMLREEAYEGVNLDQQLEQQTRRFLSDRTRNRFNAKEGSLELSQIFDWYGADFEQGYMHSVGAFIASYAETLTDDPEKQKILATAPIEFLEYDWKLNDVP